MGFFSKKNCDVCGNQMGVLESKMAYRLKGGALMCSDCMGKCSPLIRLEYTENSTPGDIREHIEYVKSLSGSNDRGFVETDRLVDAGHPEIPAIMVDATHGLWKANGYPEIFTFDQMGKYYVEPDESFGEDDFTHKEFIPPRPDMKAPNKSKMFYRCMLTIEIKNLSYANGAKITFQASPSYMGMTSLKLRGSQLDESYGAAAKYLEFLDKYKGMFS